MTSDIFQEAGNTEDNNKRCTMSFNAGKIHGKGSLMIAIGTLSYPGALLDSKDKNPFDFIFRDCLKMKLI